MEYRIDNSILGAVHHDEYSCPWGEQKCHLENTRGLWVVEKSRRKAVEYCYLGLWQLGLIKRDHSYTENRVEKPSGKWGVITNIGEPF
jgi:hypothetical protein